MISIAIVLLMCYGNLRGIREAGRAFAVPTYLFSGVVILMIVTGLVREVFGTLPRRAVPAARAVGSRHRAQLQRADRVRDGLRAAARVRQRRVLADRHRGRLERGQRVPARPRASTPARCWSPRASSSARSWPGSPGWPMSTHAAPYVSGVPTVIAQEARDVFGHSTVGTALFVLVQAATALILYTGGNTSFNGFPFLANFVAEDAFLPRWLTKRGHRLVFSNGIIVLAVLSCSLLAAVGANVNKLVPFYAIGVFTAFTMAGFGMAKYHHTHQGAALAAQAGDQLLGGRDVAGRRADLRRGQVHRGRLAGGHPVRDRGARPDPAEPGVRDGGPGPGADRRPARSRSPRRRTTRAGPSSSSWTTSTWPRWPPCATPAACGRPRCARCTSSSTPCRRTRCARTGSGPTWTSCSTSSTARTGGWPGPRPNWSARRRRCPARGSR